MTTPQDPPDARPRGVPGRRSGLPGKALALALGLLAGTACGRDLYTFDIRVDDSGVVSSGVNDIRDLVDLFQDVPLKGLFPDYSPGSSVGALVDLRGIRGILGYESDSSVLRLALPELGLDVRFPGGSRDESGEMLRQWLKGLLEIRYFATSADLRLLLRALVRYSPVDPVAGNPNSLQTRMFLADFDRGFSGLYAGAPPGDGDTGGIPGGWRFDVDYGAWSAGNSFRVQSLEGSLGGRIPIGNRDWALLVDWPLMVTWTETSESAMTHPGLGLQYRVNERWTLTAFGRTGAVGSLKLGALAGMYSGTLTSSWRKSLGRYAVGWGLMTGFNRTINGVQIDNYDLEYGLANYPVRTGIDFGGPLPVRLGSSRLAWSVYGNYTHLFGSAVFLQDMGEAGVGLSLVREHDESRRPWLRMRIGSTFGEDYLGVSTRLGFDF